MQARVTCPACQTALAVNASYGEGTVLRCPRCRHEFAVRFRPPPTASVDWPANDPLSAPPLAAPTPFQNEPSASQMRQPRLPPAGSPTEQGGSGGSMLWIGIGAGAAIAVACLVLMVIVTRLTMPAAGNGEDLAGGDVPPAPTAAEAAASPAADPLASASVPGAATSAASSGAIADLASSGGPVVPVSSITPPASAAPPPAPAAPPLAYRFNSDEEYGYAFTVKAEAAGIAEQSSGTCLLSLSRDAVPAEFAAHNKSGQGSGSGFVVTSDGYVVTCAHVVEGSPKIDVALGGQNYPGQVVAFDKTHDLAVVRIVATSLPTIPLANSDSVELAQEVRAVGYPLSNVLGDSVKITRGSVAGVVNTEGRKLFQVDASINPGNSGGPLVNEMGQVIGVASAKLAGEDIDGVGFAVPANEVLALLRTKGLSLAAASGGTKLEGPALARRVTPAVAMLKVTIGPGGYGTANRFVLDFSGQMSSAGPPRTVGNMLVPGTPKLESDRGKLLVSERGEMLDATGKVHLPHLLGLYRRLANRAAWLVGRTHLANAACHGPDADHRPGIKPCDADALPPAKPVCAESNQDRRHARG